MINSKFNIFFEPVDSIIFMYEGTSNALKRLDIFCLRDLLFYKPYSYNIMDNSANLATLPEGALIQAEVTIKQIAFSASGGYPIKVYATNSTGGVFLVFFNKIPEFIYNQLKIGTSCIILGKVQYFLGEPQISHPDFIFTKELLPPVEPIYHLTYGMHNRQLYSYILKGIKALEKELEKGVAAKINMQLPCNDLKEYYDSIFMNEEKYMIELLSDIKNLHMITQETDPIIIEHDFTEANINLSAKELFANQIALKSLRQNEQKTLGRKFTTAKKLKEKILNNLGFRLTNAQRQAIKEIEEDQESDIQMMRLLQGDVGSGKTLVALLTMANVVNNGVQTALMAPTDLLSTQHYQFFKTALADTGLNIALLTGKTKDKRKIKEHIESGQADILIGTHALFQEDINFKDLGYIIIDEQHRFGVQQRMKLINKASHPDVLVMTATPIPRSLTLTMFGDMSTSMLKEKPKNRLSVVTKSVTISKKKELIESLRKKIDSGEKIYWICPLVEQSEVNTEAEKTFTYSDVATCFAEIEKLYPGKVGILHGKIKAAEKDATMQKFKDGTIMILVATTVVEVGIDVPDATLIIIENAEKFGLAQLHQLRGRVGRGTLQSHCILMYNPRRLTEFAKKRLEIMKKSQDGFYIAEQDLILRGGGEILGTKQSGEPELLFADLARDTETLIKANDFAEKILDILKTDTSCADFIKLQTKIFAKAKLELTKSG